MKQIGNYRVEDIPIGSGGMGEVLRGVNKDGKPIALKKILPQFVSDFEYRIRIQAEINFLRQIKHPNVVKVYDQFLLDGNLYIVMELIDGKSLEDYVKEHGPIPWSDAAVMMCNLLDTIQYVHEQKIIHRDIKPGNVMVKPDNSLVLIDFGVAKNMAANQKSGGTVLGSVIGTDGYMSPEQASGLSIDHRSDVYALGCVFFFMLTGQHAFGNCDSDIETQRSIVTGTFPRLDQYVRGIPSAIQEVLDSAVEKNMMKRYQSCREFREQLLKRLPASTLIKTGLESDDISVTIGREGCDICIGEDNFKVSRHHAVLKRKLFTGGMYYVYTDESSNGTTIDGQHYTRGMSYNIPPGVEPEILLADDPSCRLDVAKAVKMLNEIAKTKQSPSARPPRTKSVSHPDRFFGSVGNCFIKYFGFKGYAHAGEFWYFALFNMLILGLLGVGSVYLIAHVEMIFAMAAWSLLIIIPTIAVTGRRLREINNGFFASLLTVIGSLIPLYGIAAAVYLYFDYFGYKI